MGFLICCDNKKCGKSQEALLDRETNDVYCAECGEIIKNVTTFAKTSMRSMSQFKRTVKSQEAFAVKCEGCQKMSRPKFNKLHDALTCPHCGQEYTELPTPYAHAIKLFLLTNPVSLK